MALFDVPPTEPTSGERIRTILAAAQSMTVVTDDHRTEVSRTAGPHPQGQIHLCTPASTPRGTGRETQMGSGTNTHADPEAGTDAPPWGCVAASLEFTDIAPTAVRDRVRARVTVFGWLAASGEDATDGDQCLEFSHAVLETANGKVTVGPAELMAAPEDPLATCEAGMLTHLVDDHEDVVSLLVRLVDARFLKGAERIVPLAIDRYGITLRIERGRGSLDVRLPFPSPIDNADQAGIQIHALLAHAQHAHTGSGSGSGPGR
ncbi:DUF2470 domain-containing protein [Streptomyces sp. NBC_01142]|uniref:DUF2470 domain-containing protein n=1 Tax=Streptomyces sp. NBC_01142 TaxID=2975865 RepID=UPI002253C120|nr:DUF2470 domain-containing protein [Streptomyces sp. NBC_01142]MCX4825329.1 DUF2470 domain-containing protein [Streptomyces sp. NBC_01142]